MTTSSCPLPRDPDNRELLLLMRLLKAQRIAVVGLSDDPTRPSYGVASYLQSVGKEIIPVNPNHSTVMGLKSYPSLQAIPGLIDLVDVFRRPEACPQVVRDAIAAGAKAIWLQAGIVSEEAHQLAQEAGLDFVQDRCLMVEHRHHAHSH